MSLNPDLISKAAKRILRHEGVQSGSLSIVFVTDQKIKILNQRYLKRNHPTDVLTFDFCGDFFKKDITKKKSNRKSVLEGEIVISTTTAYKNAKEYGTTPLQEVILYIIHGILHLRGYDDYLPKDVKVMRQKEKVLMGRVDLLLK